MMRLVPFQLRDGAVVHPSVTRSETVKRMAKDLVQYEAFACEKDAIRSLMWTQRYSTYDIVLLVDDARQVAQQEVVAREMGKP